MMEEPHADKVSANEIIDEETGPTQVQLLICQESQVEEGPFMRIRPSLQPQALGPAGFTGDGRRQRVNGSGYFLLKQEREVVESRRIEK